MEMLALLSTGWNSGIYWGQQVWDVLPTWGSANLGEKREKNRLCVCPYFFHFVFCPEPVLAKYRFLFNQHEK